MAPPEFERAVSFGTYEGELRALVQMLKFDGVPGVAAVLGDWLAEAMLALEPVEMLVVAVPLFGARERQRGYNQSVLLADRALARLRRTRPEWKLTAAHGALKRVRRTESQYVLSRRGRRRNLRGAFAVAGDVSRARGAGGRRHYDQWSDRAGVCAGAEGGGRGQGLGGDAGAGAEAGVRQDPRGSGRDGRGEVGT